MTIARTELELIAAELHEAQRSGVPCPPVRERLAAQGIADAYRVQQINVERSIASGRRVVGRKIGLTSPAVQLQLGVDQPDYGTLFAHMAVPDGGSVLNGAVMQAKVEAEIALILDRDLDVPDPTLADLLRASAFAVPAIEIVGSRIADWNIRILDTIADNASSGMFVLGSPARRIDGLDFTGCTMRMQVGDAVVSSGVGRNCLGSPLSAALWLASTMHREGTPLSAGDIVLTGALGRMHTVQAGDRVTAEITGFGAVSVAFDASSRPPHTPTSI
jgi:2-keto-4-pentenoate hydratase